MPRQHGRITSRFMALRRARVRRPRDLLIYENREVARSRARPRIATLERDARDGDGAREPRANASARTRATDRAARRSRGVVASSDERREATPRVTSGARRRAPRDARATPVARRGPRASTRKYFARRAREATKTGDRARARAKREERGATREKRTP